MKRNHSFSKALYFLIVLLYMYISFQRGTVPGQIFDELAADFSLGAAKLARIGTFYMLVYAFAQVPCGILIHAGIQPQGIVIDDKRKIHFDVSSRCPATAAAQ